MPNNELQTQNSQFILYQDDNGVTNINVRSVIVRYLLMQALFRMNKRLRKRIKNLRNITEKRCYSMKAISIERLKN